MITPIAQVFYFDPPEKKFENRCYSVMKIFGEIQSKGIRAGLSTQYLVPA